MIARNYSSSKWEIVVIKVIKPKDTPLGAVIGNYSIVDEPDAEGKVNIEVADNMSVISGIWLSLRYKSGIINF